MFYLEENIPLRWKRSGIMVGFLSLLNANILMWYDPIQGNKLTVIYDMNLNLHV